MRGELSPPRPTPSNPVGGQLGAGPEDFPSRKVAPGHHRPCVTQCRLTQLNSRISSTHKLLREHMAGSTASERDPVLRSVDYHVFPPTRNRSQRRTPISEPEPILDNGDVDEAPLNATYTIAGRRKNKRRHLGPDWAYCPPQTRVRRLQEGFCPQSWRGLSLILARIVKF